MAADPHKCVYLSVDLDYWTARPEDFGGPAAADLEAATFLTQVLKHAPQVILVNSHEEITPHVNGVFPTPIRWVVNVDFHSDLPEWGAYDTFPHLNEGTWGLYVAMAHTKVFEWRTANRRRMDSRRCTSTPFDAKNDPFRIRSLSPYLKTVHKVGLDNIHWLSLAGAAICISPAWWGAHSRYCAPDITMPLTKEVLGLLMWPPPAEPLFQVLKGKPVFDAGYQHRIAVALQAGERRVTLL